MSLLTSVQESQPGYSYYSNVSGGGGGGGGAGSFTTLNVTGQSTLAGVSISSLTVNGQTTLNATTSIQTLSVSGTTTLGGDTNMPLSTLYSQRQTLSAALGSNFIPFNGITVFNGTFACTVRGADNISFYSAMASLWGNASTGAGQEILKIGDSSNVAADPSSSFTFTATNDGGEWDWTPVFTSSVVTSGSNFTCTLSPNFG